MKFFVELLPRLSKLIHALAQALCQFGKLFRAKQDENDHEDQYPLRWTWRHKSDRIHTFLMLPQGPIHFIVYFKA